MRALDLLPFASTVEKTTTGSSGTVVVVVPVEVSISWK